VDDRTHLIRWRDPAGMRLAARVLDRIRTGRPFDDLPVGRYDGRVDLRGFTPPDPQVIGADDGAGLAFHGVTLVGVDLTGARLESARFFDTTLRDCRFDRARCPDWAGWNLTVEDCTFTGAQLRGSALGTWYQESGNRFHRVDFRAADLRDIACEAASFTDCDFSGARLDTVEFRGCVFVRCRFGGVLDEVRFRAQPPDGADTGRLDEVDFSAAILRWVEFRGLSLDHVTLPPEDQEHVVVRNYPHVVRSVVDRLADDHRPEVRRLRSRMQVELRRLDDDREVGLWHRDELGETPEQQDRARALLHEVERECAPTS
jgi:uncharacterized protein YjbI with pentapeptide repeats